jgi:uncharacterized protein (TIGR00269 family)
MRVYRCRKCAGESVINMRQHRLALCETHFVEWVQKVTLRFIEKHRMFEPDDRILVAVSGGKDSLSLWSLLLKLGFQADGLYMDLGIDDGSGYSRKSGEHVQKFAESIFPRAKLHVLNVADICGKSVPQMVGGRMSGRKKFCSVCGLVKRHEMNRVARELGYTVLATGHNLDDEAAVLFGNVLHWEAEYLVRQSPVLPAHGLGLVKRVKPLARFYERETAAYAIICNIDYIMEECPFSVGATSLRLKEVLNRMENRSPGTKLQFYFDFLRVREKGIFPALARAELHSCPHCVEATGASGQCAFCCLLERAR